MQDPIVVPPATWSSTLNVTFLGQLGLCPYVATDSIKNEKIRKQNRRNKCLWDFFIPKLDSTAFRAQPFRAQPIYIRTPFTRATKDL